MLFWPGYLIIILIALTVNASIPLPYGTLFVLYSLGYFIIRHFKTRFRKENWGHVMFIAFSINVSVPGWGRIQILAYLVKSISLGSITINPEFSLDAFFIGKDKRLLSSVKFEDITRFQSEFSKFQTESVDDKNPNLFCMVLK